jgi:hypothetical protein
VKLFHCLLLVLFVAAPALAQTGALRGQVTDESGALVPGAKVSLTSAEGVVKTATTDDNGAYIFAALIPGEYRVLASAPELATPQQISVTVGAGVMTLNLQVKVVSTAQRVTVEENAGPTVSTEVANNASALVLRGEDLQALSDDPDDLLADLQALAGPSAGPSGGAIFIDGFSGGELPPKESIREIRINSNPFSPEYDKLGYGRIEILTKPGTDHYRGTLDYNYANDVWNSRNPYSAIKAPLLLNELEGNISGPINKRMSFNVDGQRNTVDNGAIINAVALDPVTFAIQNPYFSVVKIPQRFTRISPRVDYQLNDNNTLVFRYSITHSDIPGTGIGSLDLATRGYDYQYTNQTVQITETAILGGAINETRFQYFRNAPHRTPDSSTPEIQVLGAFDEGGATVGKSSDTQNSFELQNYTTIPRAAHVWKFGVRLRGQMDDNVSYQNFNGTFVFGGGTDSSSIERYQLTEQLLAENTPAATIRQMGGGATQFTISRGLPELAVHRVDVGIYAGDDWRLRPNITLSAGLRYETQTNIHDERDFAPRIAIAWAPGGNSKNPKPKTVFRAGFGTFYDRFALANTLTAQRYNGVVQQQFVILNPDVTTFDIPLVPSGVTTPQVTQEVSSRLRAPYILQSSVSLERQLPASTTVAISYTNSHGVHQLRSNDINAPLPNGGLFPLGQPNPVFLMESSGIYNQNQMVVNVNTRVNAGFSLFGFYVLNKAMSNTDGLGTFPANPYNYTGEYGPASTDVRHRATIGGSINLRWNVRLSPFVIMQSGTPFDITAGSDLFGTTLFNARPGIATTATEKSKSIQYGSLFLDPTPVAGEQILSRNFGRGPGQYSVNLRLGKSFGFGGERAGGKSGGGTNPSVGGANPNLATGRGIGSLIGAPTTNHRYNLSVSMAARNLLNHTNPGPINGDITSPLFGRANQMAGGANGEGFSENANNRRLELQMRFTF